MKKIILLRSLTRKLVNQKLLELKSIIKELRITSRQVYELMDKLKDKKDSISEMNAEDLLMLEELMEKKGQLEQMISNVMKCALEAQNSIATALKAS